MLANVGLPLLPLHWAFAVLAFVPVAWLEAWLYRRSSKASWGRSTLASVVANVVTTVLGVPVAWLATTLIAGLFTSLPPPADAGIESLLADAVWLEPALDDRAPFRVFPIAVALLLLPCLALSILIERPIVRSLLRMERAVARRAVRRANLASYSLLWGFCAVWLVVTHLRPVGLPPGDARVLADLIGTVHWEACGCGEERARGHPSRHSLHDEERSPFAPPRYGLSIPGLDPEQQACIAAAARAWLVERGLGPLRIDFVGGDSPLDDREVVLDGRPAPSRRTEDS